MNLDQHIKNKFDEQSFEFKEEYWNQAYALIDAHHQKKKRRILFWWSFSLSSIVLVLLSWLFYSSKPSNHSSISGDIKPSNHVSKPLPSSQDPKPASIDKTPSLRSQNTSNSSPNQSLYTSNTTKSEALLVSSKSLPKNSFNQGLITNNTPSQIQAIASSVDPVAESINIEQESSIRSVREPSNETASIGKIPLLGLQNQAFDVSSIKSKENEKSIFFIPYMSVGAYAGVNTSQKQIAFNALFDEVLQDKRKREETAAFSNQLGLEFLYNPSPTWSFSVGLEYASYAEQIKYAAINKQAIDIQDNSYYQVKDSSYWSDNWVTVNGISVLYHGAQYNVVKDTLFVQKIDSTRYEYSDNSALSLNGKNTFTYIEVPLMLGYQVPFKQLEVQIQSGVSMGFLQKQEARYLVDVQNIENQDVLRFNKQVYSGLLRLSILYPLTRKTKLYVQPAFKKQFSNSVESAENFTQRTSSYQINVGVRVLLR